MLHSSSSSYGKRQEMRRMQTVSETRFRPGGHRPQGGGGGGGGDNQISPSPDQAVYTGRVSNTLHCTHTLLWESTVKPQTSKKRFM